jgi:transposase
MELDEDELRQLCVEIVEQADAAAVTPGVVRQELRVEHDIVYDYNTVSELMHEMEDDGDLVYHLGEYNEFAVPE